MKLYNNFVISHMSGLMGGVAGKCKKKNPRHNITIPKCIMVKESFGPLFKKMFCAKARQVISII